MGFSLLRLSYIGCGAMHLQSASLKNREQAPIFNLALCTFGATAIAFGLIAVLYMPRSDNKSGGSICYQPTPKTSMDNTASTAHRCFDSRALTPFHGLFTASTQ